MVGRLARYLRFVGCDTVYARGWSDDAIVEFSRRDDRVLLTRDRALARRASRVVLLTGVHLVDQWTAVRQAFPEVPQEIGFERCTECNGRLASYRAVEKDRLPSGVPRDRVAQGLPLYQCEECGHLYWEGSHAARLRAQLRKWAEEAKG
jgi:hypothetical protein